MSIWWNVVAIVVSAFVLYIYKDEEKSLMVTTTIAIHTIAITVNVVLLVGLFFNWVVA